MENHINKKLKEKYIKRIRRFRLLDDTFMKVILRDNIEGVQDIVRVLLMRSDINVTEVRIQDEWPNLVGHSVRLDAVAKDTAGNYFNIEVQRSVSGADAKRARYNIGALDWHLLPAGKEYSALPEVYVIFIMESDLFGHGLPIYTINRTIAETGDLFDDSAHIMYANAAYESDDDIGRLMADFRATDPTEMHYLSLARRAEFYKNTEGGLISLCQIMEEVRAEGRAEGRAEERSHFINALLALHNEELLLHGEQFRNLQITQEEINAAKMKLRS